LTSTVVVGVFAAAATLVPAASATPAPYSPPAPPPAGALTVDRTGWAGHGELAFVSRSRLYTLSASGHLAAVSGPPSSGYDSNPEWSPDGEWLAFFHTGPASGFDVRSPSLWLVAASSGVAHRVTARPIVEFHWSPTAETLAYLSGTRSASAGSLWQSHPGGTTSTLVATNVQWFLWSPSGRQVAVLHQTWDRRASHTSIEVVPADGGPGVTWWQTSSVECVTLASYDPTGRVIAAWADRCSDSADGDPLELFSDGRPPVTVGQSLIDMSSLAWSSDGELAVVSPGDRTIWANGKDIELCEVTPLACHRLAIPAGRVALGPAWTTSGTLYFVLASASGPFSANGNAFYSPGWIERWQGSHAGWTLPEGAAAPRGSSPPLGNVLAYDAADRGGSLVFVRDDSLWLLSHPGIAPIRVAGPLLASTAPSGYYGLVDWTALFSWSEANGPSEVQSQASLVLSSELEEIPNPPNYPMTQSQVPW
jgi:dipeptidyl aminopeptidase/acylaminoacyl peptidase